MNGAVVEGTFANGNVRITVGVDGLELAIASCPNNCSAPTAPTTCAMSVCRQARSKVYRSFVPTSAGYEQNGSGVFARLASHGDPPTKGTTLSTDETIATNLIHTLENGKQGFDKAAEKLDDSNRPDVAAKFREFAQQRSTMSDELKSLTESYGDDADQRGTMPGAVHRGWMAVKDAFTSDDADAVIGAAETGEDHAVEQYREALEADVSPEFRPIVVRQLASVQAAHDYVRSLLPQS